jgi:hypothetical protein
MERGALMPEYRVEWSVEVEADDRQESARLALAIQQSANRAMSGTFNVWGEDDPDDPTLVDLLPERPNPPHGPSGSPSLSPDCRRPDMPKIKMICPECGSDDVTRDCLGRWSVERQTWEVSSELDNMQCEACDREIGSDGFDEVSVEANTRDIGLAISSFLEGRTFSIHHENEEGGTLDPVADAAIEAIDASDPNNLVLMLDGGQRLTVRIIAGA